MYKEIFLDWEPHLNKAKCIELLDEIIPQMDVLYENTTVYPTRKRVFRAFNELPFEKVKVVLLGQDPYHSTHKGIPNACGLSFLTETGFIPPSLRNMYKELLSDVDALKLPTPKYPLKPYTVNNYPFHRWVSEGVLLLNTALTVEAGNPGSHMKFWRQFTCNLIDYLMNSRPDIVWISLGMKAYDILHPYDGVSKIVYAAHPSPLSSSKFFGSKIYSRTNALLTKPICW